VGEKYDVRVPVGSVVELGLAPTVVRRLKSKANMTIEVISKYLLD
jgi:hypothetical protein